MTDSDKKDTGTPELARRQKVLPRLKANAGYDYDLYVVDGSEIDRLLLKGRISVNEHATLNSFMIMLHRANMLGPKSPALEKRSSSDPAWVSNRNAEQMARVTQVIRYLDKHVGEKSRRAIVDLCIMDRPPEGVSLPVALEALRLALDD